MLQCLHVVLNEEWAHHGFCVLGSAYSNGDRCGRPFRAWGAWQAELYRRGRTEQRTENEEMWDEGTRVALVQWGCGGCQRPLITATVRPGGAKLVVWTFDMTCCLTVVDLWHSRQHHGRDV